MTVTIYTEFFLLMALAAIQDIRRREIDLWLINVLLVVGALSIVLRGAEAGCIPTELIVGFFVLSVPLLILALITKDGVGGADIRIAAGAGGVLGAMPILTAYMTAALLVLVWVLLRAVVCRERPDFRQSVPFLPFLLLGCTAVFILKIIVR